MINHNFKYGPLGAKGFLPLSLLRRDQDLMNDRFELVF